MRKASDIMLLVNPLRVFEGREEDFLALWDQTSALFRAKPGFISAKLLRAPAARSPQADAPFTHVTVAEWDSAEAYAEALCDPQVRALGGLYREVCTYDPAVYDALRTQH
jgi:antibiotic biosynthesis monooxygenase (ABM) superfamily enzyme